MNDNEWLQFCIDEARNFGHADKAAALERIAAALNAQAGVVEALRLMRGAFSPYPTDSTEEWREQRAACNAADAALAALREKDRG